MRLGLTIGLLLMSLLVQAQVNLIPNWSFEIRIPNLNGDTICPGNGGLIDLAKHWGSANSSVDYYNACANEVYDPPSYGVPQNWGGWQEAFDGEAYSGFGCYATFITDAKEYLSMELTDSLQADQGYYFEMEVSLQDSENFAVSSLGALFSVEDTRFWNDDNFFDVIPQVENPQTNLLDDKENWMKISGQFVAEGGEKFMTIGCFKRDIDDNIQRVDSFAISTNNWDVSAYYVDGVVLQEDNSIGIPAIDEITFEVWPNPVSDVLHIEIVDFSASQAPLEMTVMDMAGKQIWNTTPLHPSRALRQAQRKTSGFAIDVSGWSSGMYFLKGTDDEGRAFTVKVVKE